MTEVGLLARSLEGTAHRFWPVGAVKIKTGENFRVSAKPGLWTLDWTHGLDCGLIFGSGCFVVGGRYTMVLGLVD